VESRNAQLQMSARPNRRWVLLALSLVTALACGAVVGLVGPQILIGDTARKPYLNTVEVTQVVRPAPTLGLTERLGMGARETVANQKRWETMTETERLAVAHQYRRLTEMDEAERDMLLQKYQDFRQLSDDRQADLRRRAAKLADFLNSLSPQDQALLESMSETQRAARLLELWRAREAV
jgi:hypothetical protein